MTLSVLRAACCGGIIDFGSAWATCACGRTWYPQEDGVYTNPSLGDRGIREISSRDRQAKGYLEHSKFPTQIEHFASWLDKVRSTSAQSEGSRRVALDLGCGPGPHTFPLAQAGFTVLAVDFSAESLRVNRQRGGTTDAADVLFLQEDLTRIELEPDSVDVVVMADFLQHLPSRKDRELLLRRAISALKEQGHFYLSHFNLNIKNFLKGDVHGSFAGGNIRYERLTVRNIIESLGDQAAVETVSPLNMVEAVALDRILAKAPGALYLARMAAITGRRSPRGLAGEAKARAL